MATQWHINGDYLLGCNCDYGCPCNFNARPTEGDCQGSIGFHVEDGAYEPSMKVRGRFRSISTKAVRPSSAMPC
jgi:hypothetical protein